MVQLIIIYPLTDLQQICLRGACVRVDSNRYNNEKTSQANDIDILLMGSSHAEVFNVNQKLTIASLLNKYLTPYKSYSIVVLGHYLYHCVNNHKNASERYRPKKFVLIKTWINTKVCYGHLNKYGHEVIAKRLSKILEKIINF